MRLFILLVIASVCLSGCKAGRDLKKYESSLKSDVMEKFGKPDYERVSEGFIYIGYDIGSNTRRCTALFKIDGQDNVVKINAIGENCVGNALQRNYRINDILPKMVGKSEIDFIHVFGVPNKKEKGEDDSWVFGYEYRDKNTETVSAPVGGGFSLGIGFSGFGCGFTVHIKENNVTETKPLTGPLCSRTGINIAEKFVPK